MDLPPGWTREFEGKYGAEFYYAARNVSVSVVPAYEGRAGRASEADPTGYTVRFRRLFSDRLGQPVRVADTESFGAAMDVASRFMTAFSDRFDDSSAPINAVTVETLSDVATDTDAALVDLVQDRSGNGLRAVAHCSPDSRVVVYGDEDETAVDAAYDHLREAGNAVGDAFDVGPADATAVVAAEGIVVWISPQSTPPAHGTILVLSPDATVTLPATIREAARLLDGRQE